jgi:hypothetical protein
MFTWMSVLSSNRSSRKLKVACWLSEFPIATTTLAFRKAFQALEWPLSANTPTARGWLSATIPLPSSVVRSGIWKRSMKRFTSAPARLLMAPNPTSATIGSSLRIASARVSAMASTTSAAGRTGGTRRRTSW